MCIFLSFLERENLQYLEMIEQISKKLVSQLKEDSTSSEIDEFLKSMNFDHLQPTKFFNQLNFSDCDQPVLVYADLMVQDIRESEYFYSCLIQQPISKNSEVCLYKYGISDDEKFMQKCEDEKYLKVMSARENIICSSPLYESEWVKNWKKESKNLNKVTMFVEGKYQFKLGQQFCAVCLFDPKYQTLSLIRMATKEQTLKLKWLQNIKAQQVDCLKAKKNLMNILTQICSEEHALYLLYSFLSEDSMFISGIQGNVLPVIKELLPKVCHLQVKVPFKESYFPYKNENGELINTKMQFSQEKTFVVLDFNEFSEGKETKIEIQQIDNLKALKIFVEESQTIYRWEYGQSLVSHCHSGLILKASQIITPHYNLKKSDMELEVQNCFENVSEHQKDQLRAYIQKCRNFNPILSEQSRKQIQNMIQKNQGKLKLQNILKLAKLNAMSEGRQIIQGQDFCIGKKLQDLQI